MKYVSVTEFRERGYLHELNRRFLHPLGMALEVVEEDDGTEHLGGIWDCRDDPEGVAFAEGTLDPLKAGGVAAEEELRRGPRLAALGYWVQPVR